MKAIKQKINSIVQYELVTGMSQFTASSVTFHTQEKQKLKSFLCENGIQDVRVSPVPSMDHVDITAEAFDRLITYLQIPHELHTEQLPTSLMFNEHIRSSECHENGKEVRVSLKV